MSNELMRYATGELRPRRADRPIARQARGIRGEVQLACMKVDGGMALAGHAMERAVELHRRRQQLAGEDPILDAMLMPFQVAALNHAQNIQTHLFDPWGL